MRIEHPDMEKARREAVPAPEARPVAHVRFGGFVSADWHVDVVWTGVEVDRKVGVGWAVLERPLADRLATAINAGAVFGPPEIRTDVNGRTYVHAEAKVMGRYLRSDLKKLGF